MKEELIFEASENVYFSTAFIIVCIVEVLVCIYTLKCWRTSEIGGKIGLISVHLFFLVFILCTFFSYPNTKSIYREYASGEYSIVEGVIEDYEVGTGQRGDYADRFSLEGIFFDLSRTSYTGYGYELRQTDGGVLGNGVRCKIYYVPYRYENIIMKLIVYNE